MLEILRTFFQLLMRRIGPEDLPDSGLLLAITLAAYAAAQVLPAAQVYGWSIVVAKAVLVDVALLVGAAWLLLRLCGRPHRLRRTLIALLGAGALLTLPLVPLNYWLQALTHVGQAPAGPSIAILALLTWSLVVQGHILSRAMSSSFALGILAAVAYFIVNYAVIWQIAPVQP